MEQWLLLLKKGINVPELKARSTSYKGIRMRSRLEAGFAAWLDSHYRAEIKWEYEPDCFANNNGQYLPDFRLSHIFLTNQFNDCMITEPTGGPIYVEVKPAGSLGLPKILSRMETIWASEPLANLMLAGPSDDSFWSFPIAMTGTWGSGVWRRCIGGCDVMSIVPSGSPLGVCPCCMAQAQDESPWAGKPFYD